MGGTVQDHLRLFGVDPRRMSQLEAYEELDRQSKLALKMQQAGNSKFMETLAKTDVGVGFQSFPRIPRKEILYTGSPFFGDTQPVPEALRWLRGQVEEICSLGRSVGV